jgi:hypothetical protein
MSSFEAHGKQIQHINVGTGWTKFYGPLGPNTELVVYQVAITADQDIKIKFGGPGAPATPTFSVAKGIPFVLPYTDRGWWGFDGSVDMGVDVQAATAVDVAILAMVQK